MFWGIFRTISISIPTKVAVLLRSTYWKPCQVILLTLAHTYIHPMPCITQPLLTRMIYTNNINIDTYIHTVLKILTRRRIKIISYIHTFVFEKAKRSLSTPPSTSPTSPHRYKSLREIQTTVPPQVIVGSSGLLRSYMEVLVMILVAKAVVVVVVG